VIVFIVVAVFSDVITSMKEVSSGEGTPQAQLNGKLPTRGLKVGARGSFTFGAPEAAGTTADHAGGSWSPGRRSRS